MIIKIACVGKIKEQYYTDMIDEYQDLIPRQHELKICQVDDEKIPGNASGTVKQQILIREGRKLLDIIHKTDYVIALCIDGKQHSTTDICSICRKAWERGYQTITFVIGGSLGLSPEVVKRADYKLSFSLMTFPHQLMRVMLVEQLADICTIYDK